MNKLICVICLALISCKAIAMDPEFFKGLMESINEKEGQWNYRETKNKMTDEVTFTAAALKSIGVGNSTINVENTPKGISTFVDLRELTCLEPCIILVRADDSVPKSFQTVKPFEGVNHFYFKDPATFLRYIKAARRILVQPPTIASGKTSQQGPQIIEFITSTSLVIPPLRASIVTQ